MRFRGNYKTPFCIKFALCLLMPSVLLANPQGSSIQAGAVSIQEVGNTVEVHASDRSIIHWDHFSIQSGEITRFIQPDSHASVLNRVVGPTSSLINGLLEGNGRVILINPHGVIIGQDGVVRVADFIASTHDIVNIEDWSLNIPAPSALHFPTASWQSAISHHGEIEATGIAMEGGKIVLVADRLEITGSMHAGKGAVELAASDTLFFQGASETGAFNAYTEKGSVWLGPSTQIDTEGRLAVTAGQDLIVESGNWGESVSIQQVKTSTEPIILRALSGDLLLTTLMPEAKCHMNAEGPLHLISDQGSIVVTGNGPITLSSFESLKFLANQDIRATLHDTPIAQTTLFIQTDSRSGATSLIEATHGSLLIDAIDPFSGWQITQNNSPTSFISGGDTVFSSHSSNLCNLTLGLEATFRTGGDFQFHTHSAGKATVTAKRELNFCVGGDLCLYSTGDGACEIIAARPVEAIIQGNLILDKPTGASHFPDVFLASVGSLSIQTMGDVHLGRLSLLGSGNGPILIQSAHDIAMDPTSSISLLSFIPGARQPITLVVDHAPGSIGTGAFIMQEGSTIGIDPEARAPVQIFTSRRAQNQIRGRINEASFTPGAFSVNTATEQWGIFDLYGSLNIDPPHFVIFYKEPDLGSLFSVLSQTLGNAFALTDRFSSVLPTYKDTFCITDPSGEKRCEYVDIQNYRFLYTQH